MSTRRGRYYYRQQQQVGTILHHTKSFMRFGTAFEIDFAAFVGPIVVELNAATETDGATTLTTKVPTGEAITRRGSYYPVITLRGSFQP